MHIQKKIDCVFEGGGVKGSALVGAVSAVQSLGYELENLAGTSAGAIVAALLAAGFDANQLKPILESVDYNRFKDSSGLGKIPIIGPDLNLLFREGLYKGGYFEQWLRDLLWSKNIKTFADLVLPEYAENPQYRYKFQAVASDISRGKLLVLPGDIADFGIKPDELDVVLAVRMSMSIPYFFEPVIMKDAAGDLCYIVDGGVLSNFPVWLLDDGSSGKSDWPTFGFKLVDPGENQPHKIKNPVGLFEALFDTMLEAHDARYIKDSDFMRTIPIPTLGVHTTDFNITSQTKQALSAAGSQAAAQFFRQWDFDKYKQHYKAAAPDSRTTRLWSSKKSG